MNDRKLSFSNTEFLTGCGFEDNSETDLLEFKKVPQPKKIKNQSDNGSKYFLINENF
ncbi:uncharacterized protein METZ01_LOCUS245497 [marine metagenome]|uniref:Uncharacterized protein n=1 Tax=marine metagenome TaxID=408172 RepID=A0A382I1A2_9ZZZZ